MKKITYSILRKLVQIELFLPIEFVAYFSRDFLLLFKKTAFYTEVKIDENWNDDPDRQRLTVIVNEESFEEVTNFVKEFAETRALPYKEVIEPA